MDESNQAWLHQLHLERQQQAVECLKKLAAHLGGEREVQILASELGLSEHFRADKRKQEGVR